MNVGHLKNSRSTRALPHWDAGVTEHLYLTVNCTQMTCLLTSFS